MDTEPAEMALAAIAKERDQLKERIAKLEQQRDRHLIEAEKLLAQSNQRIAQLEQREEALMEACGVNTEWPIWDVVDQLMLVVQDCEIHAWVAPIVGKQIASIKQALATGKEVGK